MKAVIFLDEIQYYFIVPLQIMLGLFHTGFSLYESKFYKFSELLSGFWDTIQFQFWMLNADP